MTENSAAALESPVRPETASCTICEKAMRKLWPSNGYYYCECPKSQFVRVGLVPHREVLRDYYDKSYEVDRERYGRNLRRHGSRDLDFLERSKGTGTLLEVGCSWGFFLEAARSRGWQVQGIELSDSAAKWAMERLGLNVTCGTIEDSHFPEAVRLNVVVAWHVIEHLPDSINFLKTVRHRLRPGGLIALRTPNIRSLPARLNGWAWHWVGAPAHLSLFSSRSLRLAVERAGFSVRHCATRRGDAYNPVFEVLSASALRTGIHHNVKRLLKLAGKNGAPVPPREGSLASRRSLALGQLGTFLYCILRITPNREIVRLRGMRPRAVSGRRAKGLAGRISGMDDLETRNASRKTSKIKWWAGAD